MPSTNSNASVVHRTKTQLIIWLSLCSENERTHLLRLLFRATLERIKQHECIIVLIYELIFEHELLLLLLLHWVTRISSIVIDYRLETPEH